MRAVEVDRDVFEWRGAYRVMSDLPLLRHEMAGSPRYAQTREWLRANDRFRRDVLARLRDEGPLRAAQIPDNAQVSWRSTGWTHSRNSSQMLEILVANGQVAVFSRDAKGRVFDLADRVYPADLPDVAPADAVRERVERRLGALGIARAKALVSAEEDIDPASLGEEAVVAGVDGVWRVDAAALERVDGFAARTALLSPMDALVFDRERLQALFGYEYILEMYKPAAKRRWGYFALPILHGDRFVGKLDAKTDLKAGVLRVNAVHEDVSFDTATTDAVDAEIDDLARWLGVEVIGR